MKVSPPSPCLLSAVVYSSNMVGFERAVMTHAETATCGDVQPLQFPFELSAEDPRVFFNEDDSKWYMYYYAKGKGINTVFLRRSGTPLDPNSWELGEHHEPCPTCVCLLQCCHDFLLARWPLSPTSVALICVHAFQHPRFIASPCLALALAPSGACSCLGVTLASERLCGPAGERHKLRPVWSDVRSQPHQLPQCSRHSHHG